MFCQKQGRFGRVAGSRLPSLQLALNVTRLSLINLPSVSLMQKVVGSCELPSWFTEGADYNGSTCSFHQVFVDWFCADCLTYRHSLAQIEGNEVSALEKIKFDYTQYII